MKIYMKVVTVLILVVVSMSSGCAIPPPTQQDLANPNEVLQITVESVPSNADVYGVSGNSAGSFLGKTPLVLKYRYWYGGIAGGGGTTPLETIDVKSKPSLPWSLSKSYLAFKCLIIADGYELYQMYEVVEDSGGGWGPGANGRIKALKGGVQKKYTAFLRPKIAIPQVTPTQQQQQQQQQQQTVVIPGSEQEKLGKVIVTSNVENAEVFVDGLFVGNTPANLKLKGGIHKIEVKKDGYKSYKRELRVFGDSETSLRAELGKE